MNKLLKYSIISLLVSIILYALIIPPKALGEVNLEVLGPVEVVNTSTLSVEEQIKYTFGDKWELAYAVMMSEGGGDPKAKNYNTDFCERLGRSSVDVGLFQINDCWHPEVSEECKLDIQCNVKEAYRISKGGTDWDQWYGYTDGHYLKHLPIN